MFNITFNHRPKIDFASLSTFSWEDVEYVDEVVADGRANLIARRPEGPGGMAWYAAHGIRRFDPKAALALAGLIGARDSRQVLQPVRRLRCSTRWLFPVAGKRTNRSEVIADEVRRLIVRKEQQIGFGDDLTQATCEAFTKLIRQAKSCLLGNLPPDLTKQWITAGNDAGTYMALGPGSRQWGKLEEFQPHALYMNFEEAQQVTGLEGRKPEEVFEALVERCQARHVIVMTGGGVQPTCVVDLITGQKEQIAPVSLNTIPDRKIPANCLGTGDVMAGTITFLLGLNGELPTGENLFEVVRFGQDVALLHLTESEAWAERVRNNTPDYEIGSRRVSRRSQMHNGPREPR